MILALILAMILAMILGADFANDLGGVGVVGNSIRARGQAHRYLFGFVQDQGV
jgi:hypothetical protein